MRGTMRPLPDFLQQNVHSTPLALLRREPTISHAGQYVEGTRNHQHASFFLSAVRGSYVPGAALVRTGYIAFSVQPISHKDIKQIFQFAGPMHMQHVALMNKFKTGLQRSWFLSLLVSVLPTDVTPWIPIMESLLRILHRRHPYVTNIHPKHAVILRSKYDVINVT